MLSSSLELVKTMIQILVISLVLGFPGFGRTAQICQNAEFEQEVCASPSEVFCFTQDVAIINDKAQSAINVIANETEKNILPRGGIYILRQSTK